MIKDEIEKEFNSLLQKNIKFVIDEKIIKKGKLLLFSVKDFYFVFTILNDKNETRVFEIPHPYAYKKMKDDSFDLDYSFKTLSKENPELLDLIKSQTKLKKSKFYNTSVTIISHN